MSTVVKALIALSALAFVLAVVTYFTGPFVAQPEGYSRASTNLALLAIALLLTPGYGADRNRPV
jgi:hypothetical protein